MKTAIFVHVIAVLTGRPGSGVIVEKQPNYALLLPVFITEKNLL